MADVDSEQVEPSRLWGPVEVGGYGIGVVALDWLVVLGSGGAAYFFSSPSVPVRLVITRHWWSIQRRGRESSRASGTGSRRVLYQLTLTLDGRPTAGDTWRRRQRGLNTAIEHAVRTGQLEHNPLKWVRTKRVAITDEVDPRVVITHAQARELLTAVSYVGSWDRARGRRLVAFFAVLYYAGLRPAEAVALREADCQLPEQGWGTLTLARTLPVTAKKWTDEGVSHDLRGLKQRDPDAIRIVPIPPRLVRALLEHIKEFGSAADGRLFRNERGGIVGSTTYSRVWEEARQLALTPAQAPSPLAGRPYDLRHAALTTWLGAGIGPGDVAKRAGNSVEVLLRRYAGCLDNRAESINRRIEQALGEHAEPELEP
jgi:integrase